MVLAFTAAVLAVLLLSIWNYRSIVTPPAFHTLAFAGAMAVYGLLQWLVRGKDLNFAQADNINAVALAYTIAVLAFALPWIGTGRRNGYLFVDSNRPVVRDLAFLRTCVHIEAACLLAIVAIGNVLLGFPLVAMVRGTLEVDAMHERLLTLPVGLIAANLWLEYLLIVQFASLLVHRKQYRWSRSELFALGALLVFCAIWQAKRQMLLIMLLLTGLAVLADRARRRQQIRVILITAAACAVFFGLYVVLQFLRVGHHPGSVFFWSELMLSGVWPLLNLDRLLAHAHPFGSLLGLLAGLVPHRWLGHATEQYRALLFEPTGSISYVQYAYMDFGYVGIGATALVLGGVMRALSNVYRTSITGLQVRLLLLWIALSSSVYAHALTLNFFIIPVLMICALPLFAGTRYYVPRPAPVKPA